MSVLEPLADGDPLLAQFLEAVAARSPKYLAGAAVGWSPAEVDRILRDPKIRALYEGAQDLMLDGIEAKMLKRAEKSQAAAEFVLTNARPSTWSHRRQSEVSVSHGVDGATKQAIIAAIQAQGKDEGGPRNLAALRREAIEAKASESVDD